MTSNLFSAATLGGRVTPHASNRAISGDTGVGVDRTTTGVAEDRVGPAPGADEPHPANKATEPMNRRNEVKWVMVQYLK